MATKKKGPRKPAPKKSKKGSARAPAPTPRAPAPKAKPTARHEPTAAAAPPRAPKPAPVAAAPKDPAPPASGDAPGPGPLPPPDEIPEFADKDERVDWIFGVMVANRWPEPAAGAAQIFRERLAAAWGVAEPTIRGYAAEAHRRVALDPEQREQQVRALQGRLLAIADQAAVERNLVTGLPDRATAIKALDRYAAFAGIAPEHKVKLTGTVSLADLDALRERVEEGDDDDADASGSSG